MLDLIRTTRPQSLLLFDFLAPRLVPKVHLAFIHRPSSTTRNAKATQLPIPSPRSKFSPLMPSPPLEASTDNVLFSIREALDRRDSAGFFKSWERIQSHNLVRFLGASELDAISRYFVSVLIPPPERDWPSERRKMVEDIAVALATSTHRESNPLLACMLAHIQRNDPQTVIKLYQAFTNSSTHPEVGTPQSPSDAKLQTGSTAYRPGFAFVLLAVATAHIMQSDLAKAMQVYIQMSRRFHHSTCGDFIGRLAFNPSLQATIDNHLRRFDVAQMLITPHSLSRRITTLGEKRAVGSLQQLYHIALDKDTHLAAKSVHEGPTGAPIVDLGWTAFLSAFLKCNRRDLASKVWDDMTALGLRPGVSMWSTLIDACVGTKKPDDALGLWEAMKAQKVKPDGLSYRALLSVLFAAYKSDAAMTFFQEFQLLAEKECVPDHRLAVYNTVLNGLLLNHRTEAASELLDAMKSQGPTPTAVSYNILLAYYGRKGDFKMLSTLVESMASANIAGDVFSYSTILSALLKTGREDAPQIILSMMSKQGIRPNVATYSAIIDQQMRDQTEQSLQAALRILDEMEKDPRTYPNEVTYTTILSGLYRGQWISQEKVEECRGNILHRMRRRHIKFSRAMYHILLKASLGSPQSNALQHAMKYNQAMVNDNMSRNLDTWYILLAGLAEREEWALAETIIEEMFAKRVQLDRRLLQLVDKIRRQLVMGAHRGSRYVN